jgi:hypothetical protein
MDCKLVVFHLSALLIVASLQTSRTQAFEVKTHEALSLQAVNIAAADGRSSLDD